MVKAKDKQVILNMVTGWLPMLSGIVIFFFLTPFMRRELGEELLGIWYLISGLNIYEAYHEHTTS